jgi:YidC/Oxa1 family membrane protein insertase
MWGTFVEILRAAIFSAAHVAGGSLGSGILLVSAGVRLALLPLTLRIARRAREQQIRLAALKPELDAIQRRYADDPARLMREIRALHAKHDIKLFTPSGFVGLAVQLPVFSGLFAAVRNGLGSKVRFLWVADLARPDRTLVLGIAALAALGISSTPAAPGQSGGQQAGLALVAVAMTIAFFWSASSAVALSAGAGSLVSVLQNWLISRDAKREPSS